LNLVINGATQTITLTGSGQAPPVAIELRTEADGKCSPCVLDFGQVNVNMDSSALGVKVVNIGSGTGTLKSATTATPFTFVGNTDNQPLVGPNGAELVRVTCRPTAMGSVSKTLTFVTDDPAQPNQTVTLKCEGVQSNLVPVPNALTITTRVHEASSQIKVTLVNQGNLGLTLDAFDFSPTIATNKFSISGVAASDTIAPGASRDAFITFKNDEPAASPLGTLTVTFDGGEKREIAINGEALETSLGLSPAGPGGMADLGPVCVGSTKTQRFSLSANAPGPFKLTRLDRANPAFSIVPVTPGALPVTILGNGTTLYEFDVAFTPSAVASTTGGFTIETDIPQPAGVTADSLVVLTGTGLPAGQNVTPVGPIDFGTIETGQASAAAQTVTLTNCSADPVTITRSEIIGDQDFKIATTPALTVPPNGQLVFELVMAPEFGGLKRAELELEYATGISRVVLVGMGQGPLRPLDEDDGDPRDSYYSCSANNGAGWLLVLGVVVVIRRRRR
jgi:hypothetical protein